MFVLRSLCVRVTMTTGMGNKTNVYDRRQMRPELDQLSYCIGGRPTGMYIPNVSHVNGSLRGGHRTYQCNL